MRGIETVVLLDGRVATLASRADTRGLTENTGSLGRI
jgi:hypothetical protein